MHEEFQGPDQPLGWVQVEDLGADALFLGLNHPLMGSLTDDLVGKSSWVYISDDRLTLRRRAEADWIGLHISNVRQPVGGFFKYNMLTCGSTQTPMWVVPRVAMKNRIG